MDEEQKKIARALVWWKPPEEVDRLYLIRRIMEMGTPEMVGYARECFGEAVMRGALTTAEPGNFSERSWNYWHVVFGLRPTPPLPHRNIPESPHVSAEIRYAAASPACAVAVGPPLGGRAGTFGGDSPSGDKRNHHLEGAGIFQRR